MMYNANELQFEAQEVLDKVWFVQSLEVVKRTDFTISLRLHIRPNLFVHVFWGELSGSLYFALIEENGRIFGIDHEADEWHIHPYDAPHQHKRLSEGLYPKPLFRFLARVEELLLEHDLL